MSYTASPAPRSHTQCFSVFFSCFPQQFNRFIWHVRSNRERQDCVSLALVLVWGLYPGEAMGFPTLFSQLSFLLVCVTNRTLVCLPWNSSTFCFSGISCQTEHWVSWVWLWRYIFLFQIITQLQKWQLRANPNTEADRERTLTKLPALFPPYSHKDLIWPPPRHP